MVAMDNTLVYTDTKGSPEYVLDANGETIEENNNIQQDAIEMEKEGYDHELQRAVLESVYGEGSASFREGTSGNANQGFETGGAGFDQNRMGEEDRSNLSLQKRQGAPEVKGNNGETIVEMLPGNTINNI